MSRSASVPGLPQRLRRRLRAYRWRPMALLAGFSLVFSLALVGYLFGLSEGFLGRLFSAFLVVFSVLSFTFLAAVPFVGWAAANWFGRGWAAATAGPGSRPRRAEGPAAGPPPPARRAATAVGPRAPAARTY